MNKFTKVSSIKGLYDEKAKALSCSINNRKHCFRHKWINASLRWESVKKSDKFFSINFEADAKKNSNYEWGKGYGGIRFCEKCKVISCIHFFEKPIVYRVYTHDFYYASYHIALCKICGRRILRSSCGCYDSTKEAWVLIMKIAKELKVPYTGDPRTSRYGSNFFIILPAETARLLKHSKKEAGQYVRNIFLSGKCI